MAPSNLATLRLAPFRVAPLRLAANSLAPLRSAPLRWRRSGRQRSGWRCGDRVPEATDPTGLPETNRIDDVEARNQASPLRQVSPRLCSTRPLIAKRTC